ncbi:23S rRNA (pseudouridine(1915)-N(3))-methyltransferase RlmH [Bacteroidales bacterium OttesenSCG-928-B11]|nr:23S rRNA (pseudouridine(1915)-N(3))-methyltransferase RlmH [Bacteroidales bacterium OttesenSCG-928-E04]MDL2309188.1 23S rRNA (pseudouridine(1915)-N(3))-methyltransferase RlmH [Bacteroidales bacterium OttesenSCG-928-C03]MDL2312064.1 23S rRNA (pseudouridine(1915)-N(3))-methyltransferase RlmH [Bacteroidales bacterium OttesenSCG-928-B11]MDL2325674.1 23S rRNA (pseudouridine(1915)-N(3))-methyltransferase RlmH [Bacteroidales bacterium OttesenSCG-928-A14]
MKIKLLFIGKEDADELQVAISSYSKKINYYNVFEQLAIPYLKNSKSLSFDEQKKREGELIMKKIEPKDFVVLLDEKGGELGSVQFANLLQQQLNSGVKSLVFVIGGAYGFSQEVYARGNYKLSLSKMTFPHIVTRLIFAEQLYRAFTILKNEPYHHK